ncbi:MAG: hypothetical protein PXX77_10020, partial [Gallionella sp.]|nr:hypothetical protein [Gallionella sp.]
MSRSTNLHTSPSLSSAQLSLRNEVANTDFKVETLRDLLWLVNAHDELVAFPFICHNLIQILTASTAEWDIPLSSFHLHDETIKLLEWIVAEETRLTLTIGPKFGLKPKKQSDNPVVGRGSSRHPAYAALCNSQASDLLKDKFRLLQGHLLYAQANELQSQNNRDAYESYGGQTPWKGLPNSPSVASLAVRQLSEHRFSDVMQSLSVEQPPQLFAKSLNNLPTV